MKNWTPPPPPPPLPDFFDWVAEVSEQYSQLVVSGSVELIENMRTRAQVHAFLSGGDVQWQIMSMPYRVIKDNILVEPFIQVATTSGLTSVLNPAWKAASQEKTLVYALSVYPHTVWQVNVVRNWWKISRTPEIVQYRG
jgi:hypothetical protein